MSARERPILFSGEMVRALLLDRKTQTRRLQLNPLRVRVGDRLWVRETLRLHDPGMRDECWMYQADGAKVQFQKDDPRVPAMLSWAHHKEGHTCVSIHMPRWASRITLEVTAVRTERLHEISEADALAEGVTLARIHDPIKTGKGPLVDGYALLWDKINGKRAPWASNPWVAVITFRRC